MYQGLYDLAVLAVELRETIINGNWSDAIAEIRKLNSLQALYLISQMDLSDSDLERLARIGAKDMNEGKE